jgi:hypothetical protein
MRRLSRSLFACLFVWASAAMALAQGIQTGTIRGVVRDDQGLPIPGVTITATSPSLQGPRATTTDTSGAYTFPTLPPGPYTVKYELSNFSSIERQTTVALGLAVDLNVTLKPAGVTESVQVVVETPAPIATPVIGANVKHDEVEALATPRTIQGIATLAPAVTEYTPNGAQLVINGAFAFDNVFMMNGVDINDNLFANPQNLFIEDAIEETQVLTSGISAEYGRFSGGVINAITKSGGNTFSGSFRTNFTNASWSKETPFEVSHNITHPSSLQESYEGVLGGPIVHDRLWFFTSGRYAPLNLPRTVQQSGVQVIQNDKNKRGEVKLTATVAPSQTIQGGYLNNARTVTNTSGIFSLIADPHGLISRSLPNAYYYTNYKGVVGNGLLIEAQYSQRNFEFQGDGGTSTNIVDSPFFSNSLGLEFNAPYFAANDPEQRNNRQLTANVTKFWAGGGRHQTKGGYEFFRSQRTGGNSQSSTQYVFDSDWATDASGKPLLDSQGRFIPVFAPGSSGVDFFPATIGATLNIDNHSAYVQDHWVVNARLSADLGARYEHVKALSTGNIVGVDNNRIVPRLALTYDILGNGNHVAHVTFSQYSGRYNEALIGANSPVGNPSDIFSLYQGPAGQGVNFAPGFDVKNYPVTPANASVTVPTANIFIDPNTKSPLVSEVQASYGVTINNGKGYAEAGFVYRKTTSLIDDFITRSTGTTHVTLSGIDAGVVTNHVFENTDLSKRMFSAMNFVSRYRLSNRWTVNGQYTLGLKDDGNFEGEGTNTPGSVSRIGDYPEAYTPEAARFFPDGRLQSFERHRLRAWTIYNIGLGRAGDVSLSGLLRADSGQVYSLRQTNVALTSIQRGILTSAGYPDAPGRSSVYFSSRGSEEFNGYGALDLDISYNIPVFRSLRPWVKFDVFNALNNDKLISWNTTVSQDPASPLDALGYRTGFIKGPSFGQATSASNYIPPFGGVTGLRTFQVAVGVRF